MKPLFSLAASCSFTQSKLAWLRHPLLRSRLAGQRQQTTCSKVLPCIHCCSATLCSTASSMPTSLAKNCIAYQRALWWCLPRRALCSYSQLSLTESVMIEMLLSCCLPILCSTTVMHCPHPASSWISPCLCNSEKRRGGPGVVTCGSCQINSATV